MRPVLYHYWRSSSSWRVRWALMLKGVEHDAVAVDLLRAEQGSAEHLRRNPLGLVPVLQLGEVFLAESVAIIEYLEEQVPDPPLLPRDPLQRARVRQLVEIINAGTQPLQNLSVLRRVSDNQQEQRQWAQHFIRRGLSAYEALIASYPGPFSVGSALTAADLFLVPQCYNARRHGLDLTEWPRIAQVEAACLATTAARTTSPEYLNPG
ncbi:MAG: maleylacetoacetate isomerase [Myxococcales bacterium]|nr:maleylacetoacetate isomerase [Myxococcota bacterium]MDW8282466.1 maleylacetoacetate isomerase [Myxococcales bacterium]